MTPTSQREQRSWPERSQNLLLHRSLQKTSSSLHCAPASTFPPHCVCYTLHLFSPQPQTTVKKLIFHLHRKIPCSLLFPPLSLLPFLVHVHEKEKSHKPLSLPLKKLLILATPTCLLKILSLLPSWFLPTFPPFSSGSWLPYTVLHLSWRSPPPMVSASLAKGLTAQPHSYPLKSSMVSFMKQEFNNSFSTSNMVSTPSEFPPSAPSTWLSTFLPHPTSLYSRHTVSPREPYEEPLVSGPLFLLPAFHRHLWCQTSGEALSGFSVAI